MTIENDFQHFDIASAIKTRRVFRFVGFCVGFVFAFYSVLDKGVGVGVGIGLGIFLGLFGYVVAEIARQFVKSQRQLPKAVKAGLLDSP